VSWPGEQAKRGAHRRLLGDGRWNPFSGERAIRSGRNTGVQALALQEGRLEAIGRSRQ
jgi:hypothetical protein